MPKKPRCKVACLTYWCVIALHGSMACVAPLQDVLSVRGSCTTVGAWASVMEGMVRVGEGDIVILCILVLCSP